MGEQINDVGGRGLKFGCAPNTPSKGDGSCFKYDYPKDSTELDVLITKHNDAKTAEHKALEARVETDAFRQSAGYSAGAGVMAGLAAGHAAHTFLPGPKA